MGDVGEVGGTSISLELTASGVTGNYLFDVCRVNARKDRRLILLGSVQEGFGKQNKVTGSELQLLIVYDWLEFGALLLGDHLTSSLVLILDYLCWDCRQIIL